ncbi:MAG: type IX secretion system membrane protein PorP/SprF [Flavobacteriaceae bacterium]|nr:type IX secretion system membrane protein PorP/SprF [Flavobacteriaceae bacterium]
MNRNYILILLSFILGFYTQDVKSQQDFQYTQYMYNTLGINPAYAGSREGISILALYRNQWAGLGGNPETQTLSIHSPINSKVGLGFNILNDKIFITRETYFDVSFSYTLNTSALGKLAFGVKAGGHLLDIDPQRAALAPYDLGDNLTTFNIDQNFSPQIGAGIYYYTNNFYLGLSVPNILTTDHFDGSTIENQTFTSITAEERLTYNLIAGYVFELNEDVKFKPTTLIRAVAGAPLQVDISANFLLFDRISLGAAYRWDAALSALAGFQISNNLMLGFAYDRETTELRRFNDGTYELFLRYEIFSAHPAGGKNKGSSSRFF